MQPSAGGAEQQQAYEQLKAALTKPGDSTQAARSELPFTALHRLEHLRHCSSASISRGQKGVHGSLRVSLTQHS